MNHLYSPVVMSNRFNADLVRHDATLKGWSPSRLATKARVSPNTVSRFMNGETVKPETIAKLAKALGTTVERYLLVRELAVTR